MELLDKPRLIRVLINILIKYPYGKSLINRYPHSKIVGIKVTSTNRKEYRTIYIKCNEKMYTVTVIADSAIKYDALKVVVDGKIYFYSKSITINEVPKEDLKLLDDVLIYYFIILMANGSIRKNAMAY